MSNPSEHDPTVSLHEVTITLAQQDLKPPVFVSGSFTKEPWVAEEMEASTLNAEGNDTVFTKTFSIPPGEYHYKFRLGEGDWWICDENSPIVKDEAGNSNNLLIVPHTNPTDTADGPNVPSIQTSEPEPHSPLSEDIASAILTPTVSNPGHHNFLHDDEEVVGTWGPNEEISPYHRRVSTNLGVRISRIGTFLPPESTLVDQESEQGNTGSAEKDNPIVDAVNAEHNLPASPSLYAETNIANHSSDPLTRRDSTSSTLSKADSTGVTPHIPDMPAVDRIMDTRQEAAPVTSAIGISVPPHDTTSGFGLSSGKLTTTNSSGVQLINQPDSELVSRNPKPAQSVIALPTATIITTQDDRKSSTVSEDSVAKSKAEKVADEEKPKTILFFAMVATMIQRFWKWLVGLREPRNEETPTTQG